MSISKRFSSNPEEKLEFLKEQKHLMDASITALENSIKNPPPPTDFEKLEKWVASIPHIGEYRDGKYHYYNDDELAEQQRKLIK